MIDGVNDFTGSETFPTTSTGYTGYVAWDASYLYVGMNGPDIGSNTATKWFYVYLSGAGGTTTGVTYNTQTPTLPFPAKWHLRWKADNTYTNTLTWNGTSWQDAGWSFTGDVFKNNNYLEIRISRANLGSPATESIAMGMLNEAAGVEATYAGVPSNAYADMHNPSIAHYFNFDLNGCNVPTSFTPQ